VTAASAKLEFGIGSWSFPWAIGANAAQVPRVRLDAVGLVERARALGVGLVQFADNLPLDALSQTELVAVRAKAADAGVAVEVGTRGVEPEHLTQHLELARFFGSRLVRTLTGRPGAPIPLARAEEQLRAVLPAYEQAQVSIALENYEVDRVADLAAMLKRIDSPWIGICLDTVNALGALEGAEHVVDTLAPFVLNVHLKDFDIVRLPHMMGFTVTGRPAGSGKLDVPWLMEKLLRAGRRPSAVIELWTPFTETLGRTIEIEEEWAQESIRYLRTLPWFSC
jgi:sugar phosphate isomerase/epimerase